MATDFQVGPAHVRWTDARSVKDVTADHLRLDQIHSGDVVVADDVVTHDHASADASVTKSAGVKLAIATADCAPVALLSNEVVGAVHAGWRGLQKGVIGEAAARMRDLGATDITAALGPCIHGECYEFDKAELRELALLWGPTARATTTGGKPALDMVAAVRVSCFKADVELVYEHPDCTSCNTNYFSYRARNDTDRQLMLVWRERR